MPLTKHALHYGNLAFSGLALLTAGITLFMWGQYLLTYGDPWLMANALTWTLLTVVAFLPVFAIEYVQNRGD